MKHQHLKETPVALLEIQIPKIFECQIKRKEEATIFQLTDL